MKDKAKFERMLREGGARLRSQQALDRFEENGFKKVKILAILELACEEASAVNGKAITIKKARSIMLDKCNGGPHNYCRCAVNAVIQGFEE
jgi:hypothetical protein